MFANLKNVLEEFWKFQKCFGILDKKVSTAFIAMSFERLKVGESKDTNII